MATTSPHSQPNLMSDARRKGLRTFASDQAVLQKTDTTPASTVAPTATETPTQPTTPEAVPQAAPIKAHKTVKKLNEQGEHIPAFHELSKQDDGPKTKIAIDDTEGAFSGTIITDTKKDRFKFFPALSASLNNWWKEITTPKKKQTQTYAVPQAELRKGVIQKATSKSGTIFTADSETLRERIKQREQQKTVSQPITTPPVHEPETTWSANTEPGFALLDEPDEAVAVVEAAPVDRTPQNVTVTLTKRTVTTPPVEPKESAAPAPVAEPSTAPEMFDRWAAAANQSEPVIKKPVAPTPTAVEPKTSAPIKPIMVKQGRSHFLDFDTNILSLILFFAITGFLVIVLFSGDVLNGVLPERSQTVDLSRETVALLDSATQRDMLLTNLTPLAIEEVMVLSQKTFGNSVQELRLMLGVDTPLSTERFLSLISANVEPSFAQNIVAVRLAVSNQPTRGILFGVTDPTTARGGMLAWEETMLPSVSTVFQNGFASSTLAAGFVDERIAAVDVRVLYNSDGVEKLVYGFIGDNIILITPDKTQFQTILDYK
ncbi:hypothetical protein KC887_04010 [Candidatus Kaiserbacteria bacterium]|nr:hypothetical protein [Candidatus Kaiserbacteria bacterium]